MVDIPTITITKAPEREGDTPLNENALNFFKQYEEGIKKIEPVNSGLITNPDEKDYNFWEKTGRLSLSVGQGVVNAVEEMADFADENIISLGGIEFGDPETLGKLTFTDFIPRFISPTKWKEEEYSKKRQLPVFHQPEGLAENMTESATRFVTGMIGPSKILKGIGLSGGLLKTGIRALVATPVISARFKPNLTIFSYSINCLDQGSIGASSPLP